MKFLPAKFPGIDVNVLKQFYPFKDVQSEQIQKISHKIFTAQYTYRNANLNLTVVTGMTNRFIFQIINLSIESWRVRLTCLDCNFPKATT